MLVKDLMNPTPPTVTPSHRIRDAIPLMSETGSSCLIIVEAQKPVGIVTERDVTNLFARLIDDQEYPEHCIAEIMTVSPVCVSQASLFKDALMLSRSRKLRHLPVVNENEELVGVVSQSNLVDAYVQLIDMQTELEDNLEELKLLSLEDPLLGIGNRRAMEVDLKHTEKLSLRHGQTYSIGLLDIDFFKKYNDHYGHQAGDDALRAVAQSVKNALRSADQVFRYGGEELLILMPGTPIKNALQCAQRVKSSIESLAIEHSQSSFNILTVSIGVAESKDEPWSTIVSAADQALYLAKSQGRNTVVLSQT